MALRTEFTANSKSDHELEIVYVGNLGVGVGADVLTVFELGSLYI